MPRLSPPDLIQSRAPEGATFVCQTTLEDTLRQGVRRALHQALELEIEELIQRLGSDPADPRRQRVVRNGHARERTLQTPMGPVGVRAPRVQVRGEAERFVSRILPPYLRRTPSLEALVSALYLRGISTSQMADALGPILGPEAGGLSSSSVSRLAEQWYGDYEAWQQRDLSQEHLVYIWVDGIYTQVRLQDTRPCLLVIVGARADGTKTLVALVDGERESKESWAAVLRDLKRRGLKRPPKLAVGDGALGFWAALDEVWPSCQRQRCWWHKSGNVLNYLPKKLQAQARTHLHEIWQASTLKDANEAFDAFVSMYEDKYPKATRCLAKDRESLLAFYGFPAAHWRHLRTTNPIESSFATIRHRHRQTKGNGSRQATIAMLFQLGRLCEKGWRKLNGHAILADVIEGVVFRDGIKTAEKIAAA